MCVIHSARLARPSTCRNTLLHNPFPMTLSTCSGQACFHEEFHFVHTETLPRSCSESMHLLSSSLAVLSPMRATEFHICSTFMHWCCQITSCSIFLLEGVHTATAKILQQACLSIQRFCYGTLFILLAISCTPQIRRRKTRRKSMITLQKPTDRANKTAGSKRRCPS